MGQKPMEYSGSTGSRWRCAKAQISSWNCPPNYCGEGAVFSPLKGQHTGSEAFSTWSDVTLLVSGWSQAKGRKGAKLEALLVSTC